MKVTRSLTSPPPRTLRHRTLGRLRCTLRRGHDWGPYQGERAETFQCARCTCRIGF